MTRSRDRDFRGKPKNHLNPYNILPPTEVLKGYESLSPGSIKKLLDMASKEQEHRHKWQEEHLKVHARIYKWGQILAFIYNILLLGLILYLVESGDNELALKLFLINAVLMTFAILVTFIERRVMNRKPPRRMPNRVSNKKYPK